MSRALAGWRGGGRSGCPLEGQAGGQGPEQGALGAVAKQHTEEGHSVACGALALEL